MALSGRVLALAPVHQLLHRRDGLGEIQPRPDLADRDLFGANGPRPGRPRSRSRRCLRRPCPATGSSGLSACRLAGPTTTATPALEDRPISGGGRCWSRPPPRRSRGALVLAERVGSMRSGPQKPALSVRGSRASRPGGSAVPGRPAKVGETAVLDEVAGSASVPAPRPPSVRELQPGEPGLSLPCGLCQSDSSPPASPPRSPWPPAVKRESSGLPRRPVPRTRALGRLRPRAAPPSMAGRGDRRR